MVNVHIVIPSRLGSTRLPEKPLQLIGKKTLIERVFDNAKASNFSSIHIATDSDKIASEASVFCNSVILTSEHHLSGTDRINELCNIKGFDENDIIINLQGDEPFMPIEIINSMPDILNGFDIATACVPFKSIQHVEDPNNVKVCFAHNQALYFSRSVIPNNFIKTDVTYFKHIGIYAYKVNTLNYIAKLQPAKLELSEKLEQLRFLDHNLKIGIKSFEVEAPIGIDTLEDLQRAQALVN